MAVFHPVQFKGMYEGPQGGHARVSPDGYISNLFVPEDRRSQGHGSQIIQQIADDADKFGHTLKLHAFGPDLHSFYTKRGFEMTGHDYIGGIPHPRFERKPKDIQGI